MGGGVQSYKNSTTVKTKDILINLRESVIFF